MDLSNFQSPGDNTVTLSEGLATDLKKLFRKDRENRFRLFLLCHGIRQKYLDPVRNDYAKEFHDWYSSSGVAELFGKLPNFTKYAAAGEVVDFVATKTTNPTKYLKQLPTSTRALYEVFQIMKLDEEAFHVCLNFTPTRKHFDAPKYEWKTKGTSPLIHPTASSLDLAAWRKRWEAPVKDKVEDKFRRNVRLLTISVSEDIFEFDPVGNKVGVVDMSEVKALLSQIEALFSQDNEKQFKLETQIDRIAEKYRSEQEKHDPHNVLKSTKQNRAEKYK